MKKGNLVKSMSVFCVVLSAISLLGCHSSAKGDDSIADPEIDSPTPIYSHVIGSSFATPKYYFGTQDCLNEGADFLLDMGSKVIKLWYYNGWETPDIMYPWNSNWTNAVSLVDGLEQTHFKELFDKPFKTFMLNVAAFANSNNMYYWKNGITQDQIDQEEHEFYEFTKALLEKYNGTGKTFVLQHHEGDWHTRGNTNAGIPASTSVHANMVKWLNARQNGVNRARNESKAQNVFVYHAAEINIVVTAMKNGQSNIVNKVLPHTNLDLVSYSAYDSSIIAAEGDTQLFADALKYIKKMMPDSPAFGNDNVYVGEFGVPENDFSAAQIEAIMKNTVNIALDESCPYIIYWQVYDNELANTELAIPVTSNDHVRGFWLKRPDGSTSWHYEYLKSVINK